jgi:hypothetical protein
MIDISGAAKLNEAERPLGRVIASFSNYDGFIAALRTRANEMRIATSSDNVAHVAGLPDRYLGKLLAPKPIRRIGMISLAPVLAVLGAELWLIEDPEAVRRFGSRLKQRNNNLVRNSVVHLTKTKREYQKMGRIGGPLSRMYMSKERASEIGRKAAQARWSKPRVVKVKGRKAKRLRQTAA